METMQITEEQINCIELPVIEVVWEFDHDDYTGESYCTYRNKEQMIEDGDIVVIYDLFIDEENNAHVNFIKEFWISESVKIELPKELQKLLVNRLEKFYSNPFNIN